MECAAENVVIVSPEMTIILGATDVEVAMLPPDPFFLHISIGEKPTLRLSVGHRHGDPHAVTLAVARDACKRLFDWTMFEDMTYHIPTKLRVIAMALVDGVPALNARDVYRGGKGIELLCESFNLLQTGELVAVQDGGNLSLADSERVLAARRFIDDRWHEKLTLDRIARACGLNRAKLTRGFREMFDSSVADTLAERRLGEARRSLLTTDLPIASIGYRSGYLNNAAFARAFSRKFGVSPTHYRAVGLAA